ncbi:MAG: hypothetical protein IPH31_09790 [Lewinellaceae bacterium]|nr:hypothetical protein [Lewinellaceae bacterium]
MSHISRAVRPSLHGQPAEPITPILFSNKIASIPKAIHCDIVFGSPNMNCLGTGICKITGANSFLSSTQKRACQRTFGQIAVGPNGKVSLFFFREFLCIQLYRQHFRKGVLVMKEACPLPSIISKGLNITGNQLLPGNYAVVECDGYFRVDLNCA